VLSDPVVFLFDVDNTLLDNYRLAADLGERLEQAFGKPERERYWAIYAQLRDELGYADYLDTLQRFRVGLEDHPALMQMSAFMLEYPFSQRLYPHALDTIAHLRSIGRPVILSDGDVVFQPRKIQRAGLWDAFEGRVLIYLHKERMLEGMQRRYPASHYVMIDDKPKILVAMKRIMGDRLTTVFVQQGHYAAEAAGAIMDPAPDLRIEHIGELRDRPLADFVRGAASA
jgi:FMN phosphatase YigB (HAD superfamily)